MAGRCESIEWIEPRWARNEQLRKEIREAGIHRVSLWTRPVLISAIICAVVLAAAHWTNPGILAQLPTRVIAVMMLAIAVGPFALLALSVAMVWGMSLVFCQVELNSRGLSATYGPHVRGIERDRIIGIQVDDSDPRGPRLVIRFDPRRPGRRGERSPKREYTVLIGLSPRVDRDALQRVLDTLLEASAAKTGDAPSTVATPPARNRRG